MAFSNPCKLPMCQKELYLRYNVRWPARSKFNLLEACLLSWFRSLQMVSPSLPGSSAHQKKPVADTPQCDLYFFSQCLMITVNACSERTLNVAGTVSHEKTWRMIPTSCSVMCPEWWITDEWLIFHMSTHFAIGLLWIMGLQGGKMKRPCVLVSQVSLSATLKQLFIPNIRTNSCIDTLQWKLRFETDTPRILVTSKPNNNRGQGHTKRTVTWANTQSDISTHLSNVQKRKKSPGCFHTSLNHCYSSCIHFAIGDFKLLCI